MAEFLVTNFAVEGQRWVLKHYDRVRLNLREVGIESKLRVRM